MREMTEQEEEALEALATATKLYSRLPEIHPAHPREFQGSIHECQRLILARPAGEAVRGRQPRGEKLPPVDKVIGGHRLAMEASLRLPMDGEPIHYRDILRKLREDGITPTGVDQAATLLAAMKRDPAVERVAPRTGEYRRA